jgi:hypothetical protein
MTSRLKKAHRTHALAQPAGHGYPHADPGQAAGRGGVDGQVLALLAELRARVPDDAERAQLLGVSVEVEAAWTRGVALPVLRAHRKSIERLLRSIPAQRGALEH